MPARIAYFVYVLALSVYACELPLFGQGSKEAASPGRPDSHEHFDVRIAPLLAKHCLECHNPTSKKGGLDLSRRDAALAGGKSGKAFTPRKTAESLLWRQIESAKMPKGRPALADTEKQLLREWIEAGAVWSDKVIEPAAVDISAGRVRRLTVAEYVQTVRSTLGVDIDRDARKLLPPDLRADGFSNTAYNLNVDLAHIEAYARLAEIIVARVDVVALAAQYSQKQDLSDDNLRKVIAGLGVWLLRGPLEEREISAYLVVSHAVAEERGSYAEAVKYILEVMLQSPRFIYRIEKQRDPAQGLDNYELASRLSYILWGGPPDKELHRAAEAGELSDRSRVAAQVVRMLGDPRAIERSVQFVSEWMHLDRLSTLQPNSKRFPQWNDALAEDMRQETLAFFKHVAWEQKRPLAELFNAPVTFATPRLARHYGLKPAVGEVVAVKRVADGLQALYCFEQEGGDTVRDGSGIGAPIHLNIADRRAVRWTDRGLFVAKPTLIRSEKPPTRLIDAVKKSNAITLEAWITPSNAAQTGPARIATLSASTGERNITLGQLGDRFDIRLRTTTTSGNGEPSLSSASGTASAAPVHVVYTRDATGKAKTYINGRESEARDIGGNFSNWDGKFHLALANEMSRDRAWSGTFHLVALFDRALSAAQVRQNHAAGPRLEGLADVPDAAGSQRSDEGLELLYDFSEPDGKVIRDQSLGEPLNLKFNAPDNVARTSAGITVKAPVLMLSEHPPKKLLDAVQRSQAITLEAWITPHDTKQTGPARILTLSSGPNQRNFTIGQQGDKYEVRLRTSKTDGNGMPGLVSPAGAVQTKRTQVVFTRDKAGKAKLYINGKEVGSRDWEGDLKNWDPSFHFALGNETTLDRPWSGTLHGVAVYSRALTLEEIQASDIQPSGPKLARYDLSESCGRGGLLTHGSVLTIGGDEASMVTRGLFMLRELLYSGVEDPPPCVDTTPVPTKPGQSQRGIAMQRLNNQACAGCHSKFEPLAFALERFDGVGAYRETDEHGNKLRDDGEILFPDQEKPVAYGSARELMNLLAGSERVKMAITRKATQYAIGRPLLASDDATLREINIAAQKGGGTYASLMTAIVLSDLVQRP